MYFYEEPCKMIQSVILVFGICSVGIHASQDFRIQFPLTNIQSSIDMENTINCRANFSFQFQQYYKSYGYTLNLPKLNLPWPPNPYPGFIQSTEVEAICLRENGIYRIAPGSFRGVPNLKYLDLSKNRLAFCEFFDYGDCLQNLLTLVIQDNQLPADSLYREISKAGCFPQVQNLYIARNHIRRLTFSLRQSFPQLVSLYLTENEIDTCAFIRDVPNSLTHLFIERNRISSMSTAIIRNLKTLMMDGNIVKSICFKNCDDTSVKLLGTTKLEILSLAENQITQIEACAFRDSFNLMSLNLSSNSIEQLYPATFAPLKVLSQLDLDKNLLTTVPNLSSLRYLQTLSLRNNRLTELRREYFNGAVSLRRLLLGDNKIRCIQWDTFIDLTWLQELDLSNNELQVLPNGWMSGLSSLKYLDLRNNRFTYTYQLSLSNSMTLKVLYLQNNKFVQFDKAEIQRICPYADISIDSCRANCNSNVIYNSWIEEESRFWLNYTSNSQSSYLININVQQ